LPDREPVTYTQDVIAAPHFRAAGKTFDERVAWVNSAGVVRERGRA
jgi:hypothetical protein